MRKIKTVGVFVLILLGIAGCSLEEVMEGKSVTPGFYEIIDENLVGIDGVDFSTQKFDSESIVHFDGESIYIETYPLDMKNKPGILYKVEGQTATPVSNVDMYGASSTGQNSNGELFVVSFIEKAGFSGYLIKGSTAIPIEGLKGFKALSMYTDSQGNVIAIAKLISDEYTLFSVQGTNSQQIEDVGVKEKIELFETGGKIIATTQNKNTNSSEVYVISGAEARLIYEDGKNVQYQFSAQDNDLYMVVNQEKQGILLRINEGKLSTDPLLISNSLKLFSADQGNAYIATNTKQIDDPNRIVPIGVSVVSELFMIQEGKAVNVEGISIEKPAGFHTDNGNSWYILLDKEELDHNDLPIYTKSVKKIEGIRSIQVNGLSFTDARHEQGRETKSFRNPKLVWDGEDKWYLTMQYKELVSFIPSKDKRHARLFEINGVENSEIEIVDDFYALEVYPTKEDTYIKGTKSMDGILLWINENKLKTISGLKNSAVLNDEVFYNFENRQYVVSSPSKKVSLVKNGNSIEIGNFPSESIVKLFNAGDRDFVAVQEFHN